jgi:hypothetical protein
MGYLESTFMISEIKKIIAIRVLTAIIMFCFIMWGYWWMTWCAIIAFLFYFPLYYEIILWGVIYDALYGMALPEFWNIRYIFTISSVILFMFAYFLRKKLIIYDDRV